MSGCSEATAFLVGLPSTLTVTYDFTFLIQSVCTINYQVVNYYKICSSEEPPNCLLLLHLMLCLSERAFQVNTLHVEIGHYHDLFGDSKSIKVYLIWQSTSLHLRIG